MKKRLPIILLTSALILGACATEEASENEVSTDSATEETEEVEMVESEEEKEETAEEKTESSIGKRSNPAPLGESVAVEDIYYGDDSERYEAIFEVKVTDVIRGQEAFDILLSENQFNEPAPEGMEWLIVSLEGEVLEGDEDEPYTVVPWFDIVDSSGSQVSQDVYGTLDGNEFGYVDLFPGGTTSGRITLYAPEGDESLLAMDTASGKTYFSLAE